jgi:hypothetical protein
MPEKTYFGEMTDANVSNIFRDAADFIRRELRCGKHTLYAYAIDGLIAAAYASDYIFKPITQQLSADSMGELYQHAMDGMIYNCVAVPCEDLNQIAFLLVNGFCVVLFPGVGAIGYEVKTPDKRGPSAPEVENTVKGAKDAFVETVRSNTSYIRRHLRSPDLRIFETQVGKRSLTNVSVVWLVKILMNTVLYCFIILLILVTKFIFRLNTIKFHLLIMINLRSGYTFLKQTNIKWFHWVTPNTNVPYSPHA